VQLRQPVKSHPSIGYNTRTRQQTGDTQEYLDHKEDKGQPSQPAEMIRHAGQADGYERPYRHQYQQQVGDAPVYEMYGNGIAHQVL
jgi:hypothetical protein